MPVLYKLSQRQSSVHGTGTFTEEDIPAGSAWWVLDPSIPSVPVINAPNLPNIVYTKEQFKKLRQTTDIEDFKIILAQTMFYNEGNVAVYLRDGSAKMNHSSTPNSQLIISKDQDINKLKSVALRDIKAGEQILQDYSHYSKTNTWLVPYLNEVEPERLQIEVNLSISPKKLKEQY